MKITIKFPSRSRPNKFFARLDEITNLIGIDDYNIVATLDSDDISMNNASVIERMKSYPRLSYIFGPSSTKIGACNRDLERLGDFDILMLQSDDMVWQRTFGPTIISEFKSSFPDTDGVVHIPDQVAKDKLITYNILGNKYYKRFGYLYHPSYISVYADNEFTEVAQLLNRYKYVNNATDMLIHAHPVWKLSEWDQLYRSTENKDVHKKDKDLYEKRKKAGFK